MSNDLIELIKSRRSIRAYKEDEVPEEAIDAILEAGAYAPYGTDYHEPTIIAVTDKKMRDKISELNAKVIGTSADPYFGAPAIIIALVDGTTETWVEDGSCALENMMLAAHSLGLSSCWIHREREIFDSAEGKKILSDLKLSENLRGVGSIALGYAKNPEAPKAPQRRKECIVKI